jgi:hypothetical protein
MNGEKRPHNRQMEPTRLVVHAILSQRRAAHLQRWADAGTRLRIRKCRQRLPWRRLFERGQGMSTTKETVDHHLKCFGE